MNRFLKGFYKYNLLETESKDKTTAYVLNINSFLIR